MDSPVSLKKEWVLTQEAFDRLLATLDKDREQAGQIYERLRLKLSKYFEWRGVPAADNEVDETINRVARRIEEGVEVYNVRAYFYGVARMVLAESLRTRERQPEPLDEATASETLVADDERDVSGRRSCLERCLQHLPEGNRDLILEYFRDEKAKKIERRKRIASRLGIPLNALRIRVHRIRATLEHCVHECVAQQV